MCEWTPGPWSYRGSLGPQSNPHLKGPHIVEDASGIQIAIINGWRSEVSEANARLIAAAPELLRACQTFEAWLRREDAGLPVGVVRDTPEGEAQWREWYDENLRLCAEAQTQARAAIAKATGGGHG